MLVLLKHNGVKKFFFLGLMFTHLVKMASKLKVCLDKWLF